jgi:hypothetical protein
VTGTEFFVDLTFPFGWRPSEYGWAAVGRLVMWRLVRQKVVASLDELLLYVDNFFYPHQSLDAKKVKGKDMEIPRGRFKEP